jgi:rare lipoprotein A (peptidoglycan hydrolase)
VSEAAAEKIGMETLGVVPVIVEVDPAKQDDPEVRRQVETLAERD